MTPVEDNAVRGEWLSTLSPAKGVIMYVHGGGYLSCSPVTHRPITAALAKLSNMRVFSLDYRLAPEHRFPAALDDTIAGYRWLLRQPGVNASRVAISGDSAGGGLTLALLSSLRDLGLPMPACAILGSPWTDLTGSGASGRENDGRCHMFRFDNLEEFSSVYLGSAPPSDPRASPLFANLAGLCPVLIQVASTEVLLDDSRRVYAGLIAAGGESRLEVYADVIHAWQMCDGILPEARVALSRAVAFITAKISTDLKVAALTEEK